MSSNNSTQTVADKLVRQFEAPKGCHFVHSQLISHKGTLVAFILDSNQHFSYAVLDFSGEDSEIDNPTVVLDREYWTKQSPLLFTNELSTVGEGSIGIEEVPVVVKDGKIDTFMSSTARFTADAPFQVISDNQHIYLFRSSIASNHPRMYEDHAKQKPLWSTEKREQLGNSLLVNRYLLSGTTLSPKMEVRYRRSRKKDTPASNIDSLGATDMANRPFFEATQVLSFVQHLKEGRFQVLLLPTQVAGMSRWQIFTHNAKTQLMDSWNLEKSTDGLFDTKGTLYYTSPDPRFKSQVLEPNPGLCPITSQPMVPMIHRKGYAESALQISPGNYVEVPYNKLLNPNKKLTIEGWLKLKESQRPQKIISTYKATNDAGYMLAIQGGFLLVECILRDAAGNPKKVMFATSEVVPTDTWVHFAVSFRAKEGETSAGIQAYINGNPVAFQSSDNIDLLKNFTEVISSNSRLTIGIPAWDPDYFQLNGTLDEIRIWEEERQAKDIKGSMNARLQGNEPGLVAYWRFDEGRGKQIKDQTTNGLHGTLVSNNSDDVWVISTAPIGDATEMRRASFSFQNTKITGPPGATLYYQRETLASSADESNDSSIQNARVMMAVPVSKHVSGEAMNFDGKTSFVDFSKKINIDFSTGLTIEGWLKIDADSTKIDMMPVLFLGVEADIYKKQSIHLTAKRGKKTVSITLKNGKYPIITIDNTNVDEWMHVAFSVDSMGNAKAYLNGDLVVQKTDINLVIQNTYDIGFFGKSLQGRIITLYHGALTDFRIWTKARTESEIKINKDYRLESTGEPNLKAYWYLNDNQVLKDHAGQYDGTREGVQKEVALPPLFPEQQEGMATIDFGVSREGKLAQIPDEVELETIGEQAESGATTAELITKVNQKQQEIEQRMAFLKADPLRYTCKLMLYDDNFAELLLETQVQINHYNEHKSFDDAGVPDENELIDALVVEEDLLLSFEEAKHLTFYFKSLPDADNVTNRYQIISSKGGVLQVREVDFKSLTFVTNTQIKTAKVLVLSKEENEENSTFIITEIDGKMNIRSAAVSENENLSSFGFHRYQETTLGKIETSFKALLYYGNTPVTPAYNLEKNTFLGYDDPKLQELQKEWQELKNKLKTEKRYNMPMLHVDPFGFSSSAGLLSFASSKTAPYLYASSEGEVIMYFQDKNKLFSSAYFDTNTQKLQQKLNTSHGEQFSIVARNTDQGYQQTMVEVTAGETNEYCKVEITNTNLGITESWQRVPRTAKLMARVLNGIARDQSILGHSYDTGSPAKKDELYVNKPVGKLLKPGTSIVIGANEELHIGQVISLQNPKEGRYVSLFLKEPSKLNVLKGTRIYILGNTFKNAKVQKRPLELTQDLNIGDNEVHLSGLAAFTSELYNEGNNIIRDFYVDQKLIFIREAISTQVKTVAEETVEIAHPTIADKVLHKVTTKITLTQTLPYFLAANTPLFLLEYDYFKHAQTSKSGGSHLLISAALHPEAKVLDQSANFAQSSTSLTAWKSNSPGHALHLQQGNIATKQSMLAMRFDTQKYVQLPLIYTDFGEGISMELSVKISDIKKEPTLFAVRKTRTINFYRFALTEEEELIFYPSGTSTSAAQSDILRIPVPKNEWIHLAVTINNNNEAKLYLNGTLMQEGSIVSPYKAYFFDGGEKVYQGQIGVGFNGLIDDVRLWDRVLDPDQITLNARRRLKEDEEGLIANWYLLEADKNKSIVRNHSLVPQIDAWMAASLDYLKIKEKEIIRNPENDAILSTAPISPLVGLSAKHFTPLEFSGNTTLECWMKTDENNNNSDVSKDQYLIHNNGLLRFFLGLSDINYTAGTAHIVMGINDQFRKSLKAENLLSGWQHLVARFQPAYALLFQGGYLDCGGEDYYNFNDELSITVNLALPTKEGIHPILSKGAIKNGKDDGVPFSLFIQDGKIVFEYEDQSGAHLASFHCGTDALKTSTNHEITIIRRKLDIPVSGLDSETLSDFFNIPDLPEIEDVDVRDLNNNYLLNESDGGVGPKGSLTKLKEKYKLDDDDERYKELLKLKDRGFATENDFIAALKDATSHTWITNNIEAIVSAADRKIRLRLDDSGRANMLNGMKQKSQYLDGGLLNGNMQDMMGSYSLSGYQVEIYVDGKKQEVSDKALKDEDDKTLQIGRNYAPLHIGYMEKEGEKNFLNNCTISDVRIWGQALKLTESKQPVLSEDDLSSYWKFEEFGAQHTVDSISLLTADFYQPEGSKIRWVESTRKEKTKLTLLVNGKVVGFDPSWSPTDEWRNGGANQFTLGGKLNTAAKPEMEYLGSLEEVRIWNSLRTEEELLDNMHTRLRENADQLVAYYSCNANTALTDAGNEGHHLTLSGNVLSEFFPISDAPVGNDIPQVQSVLASLEEQQYAKIESSPMVQEYGDLQKDNIGKKLYGVLKRCYAHIEGGKLHLTTGFKVGNLISEWISQVQFNPQIMGYVEGAPPVPSENLTEAQLLDSGHTSRTYVGASSIEMEQSENVTYTLSHSKEGGFGSSFDTELKRSLKAKIDVVIAPFGLGINLAGGFEFGGKVKFGLESSSSFNISDSSTVGRNTSKNLSVSLGGAWEDPNNRVNSSLSRRFQPANMGFALVKSDTADVFALRMAHNRQLVSLHFKTNPDIPKDVNIIPFPINPRYTKQGSLDGRIGYDDKGVVLDPDYPHARDYGAYSYFKPKEAYRLKKKIQQEKERVIAELEEKITRSSVIREALGPFAAIILGAPSAGIAGHVGKRKVAKKILQMSATKFMRLVSTSQGMLSLPTGVGAGIAGAVGALGNLLTTITNTVRTIKNLADDLPKQFSEKDIANTYVWTADGGFYAETTSLMESIQEVTASSYQFQGDLSDGMLFNAGAEFGPQIAFELNGSMGGSLSTTKSKTKQEDRSFSLKVVADPPGDLQKFNKVDGKWERAYTPDGAGINVAGKVDAYRFMTFYLQPSSANFDELFNRVIDPIWLLQSDHPNANALRQANYSNKRPPCYRIMHRVTFVSRILPEFPDVTAPPLERLMRDININSHWELIRRIDPFIPSQVSDSSIERSEFITTLRYAVKTYLPHLDWENKEVRDAIIELFTSYYGIDEKVL